MKKKKVYEIYDIAESYPFERCTLSTGTLKDVHSAFCEWLDEHISYDYESPEEFYEDYPEVERFVKKPEDWVKHYGANDEEIYMDWKINLLCEV